MVQIKNSEFSYWAWSTPWGRVLSLKSFCWNPVLSWAIRYSVFQLVKFTSSFKFVCRTIFSRFWHLALKFGYNNWFLSNIQNSIFPFRWNKRFLHYICQIVKPTVKVARRPYLIFINLLVTNKTVVINKTKKTQ